MMPKGVEHYEGIGRTGPAAIVKIPMMPKGVEHDVTMPMPHSA